MITINLDSTFDPLWVKADNSCQLELINFSTGFEPHIKLLNDLTNEKVVITCRLKDGNDLVRVLLATDAAKRAGAKHISLFIPFVPFARQDRVMVEGEPLSIAVFAEIINLFHYKQVIIFDTHSDVTGALIKNVKIINNHQFVIDILAGKRNYKIASPDAGSYKKIFHLAQKLGLSANDIIICDKVRDVSTGKIISTKVDINDCEGKDIYIIDDICDGGRTFIEIAKILRQKNCKSINLIVSHYIGSAGESELEKHIDYIYTTNSIRDIKSEFIIQTSLDKII